MNEVDIKALPSASCISKVFADCEASFLITNDFRPVLGAAKDKDAPKSVEPIVALPPILMVLPIPTPPATTNAPVVVLVDAVLSVTPTKPDVVPVAEILPENVFAMITFVAGFTVNPLSLETAIPDPPLTGENKI